MKKTVLYGIIGAAIWVVLKLIFHAFSKNNTSIAPAIFSNMFLLLVTTAYGLYQHKIKEGFLSGNALSDIKTALTIAIPYSIIVALFLVFYYKQINPEYNQLQIQKAEISIDKDVDNPISLKKMKKDNESFEVMEKEKIRIELKKGPKRFYNANTTGLISLLALMMLSTIYSIFITVVYRKVLSKGFSKISESK